jgi:antitoxin CcdA
MTACFDAKAPKRPVNLSLNSELLALGRSLEINISSIAEEALAQAVKARLAQDWLLENAAAIQAYNDHVETHGVFSDGIRRF